MQRAMRRREINRGSSEANLFRPATSKHFLFRTIHSFIDLFIQDLVLKPTIQGTNKPIHVSGMFKVASSERGKELYVFAKEEDPRRYVSV